MKFGIQFILVFFLFIQNLIAQDSLQFSFGLLTDCQYCNCDVKWNRNYRLSPNKLRECVQFFNTQNLSFVFNLGDFIDQNKSSYDTLIPIIKNLKVPHYWVPGNHDYLEDFDETKQVFKKMGIKNGYYSVIKNNWRFIALNGNDLSVYGTKKNTRKNKIANKKLNDLTKQNLNVAKPWNGTLGKKQFRWLYKQLQISKKNKENVILFCHFPILPLNSETNLWDDSKMVELIKSYPNIKAYFAGHDHEGRIVTENNVLFYTFKAMVNTEKTAYSIIQIYPHSIKINGFGKENDYFFSFAN